MRWSRGIPLLGVVALAGWGRGVAAQVERPFEAGMVVTESTHIRPGTYRVAARESLEEALVTVRGDDLVIDMTGVVLVGIDPIDDPDQARGVAIRIEGGSSVELFGATVRGYRFGIVAHGVQDLVLRDNDVSYGWKPRLFSLVAHESLVDWMSFHDNEQGEWWRFGAAFMLEDVRGGRFERNRAVQGINGLLMVRGDSLQVLDNELAYNSALGIGMYRSSHNVIAGNRMDYNVRGYSHGFYNRGQDSAGILLYEQSSHNVIAYNSVTHGGDGLFLWAGRSTMDTGQGGANDNLVFGNDFSWAPTNSVEVTFSRNRVIANRLIGSRYGVWGGYSWESEFLGNCFGLNETGIAIEHGQDNLIARNRFDGDQTAVQLWSREQEPSDWGYPQARDTRSRDHVLSGNVFAGNADVWRLDRTEGVVVRANRTATEAVDPDRCHPRELLGTEYDVLAPAVDGVAPEVPAVPRASLDRSAIVVDEWGPYDGLSPKLWPADSTRAVVPLRVLGPEGRWRVAARRGVGELSAEAGAIGDTLWVTPADPADWSVELEYVGVRTTSPRGEVVEANVPVPFAFDRFEPAIRWDARFYRWREDAREPAGGSGSLEDLVDGEPALQTTVDRLDFTWYTPGIPELPQERWALAATGSLDLPAGEYSVRTISDDGVRVWIDGELVIDHWEPHGSRVDYATVQAGRHDLRVEYYQVGGWTELRLEIMKGSARSKGTAGPH